MIKKNYIQSILANNPQRFFTFSKDTNFVTYDGSKLLGGFYDDNSGHVLVPHFSKLKNNPREIYLESPSTIDNEPNNQSLNIGGGDIVNPYNLYFTSNDIDESETLGGNSSLSFNFKVPEQNNNKTIIVDDYERPYAVIMNWDTKKEITVQGMMYGSYFYIPLKSHLKDTIKFHVKIWYQTFLVHEGYYQIDDTQFFVDKNIDYYKFEDGREPLFNTRFSIIPQIPENAAEFYGIYSRVIKNNTLKRIPFIKNIAEPQEINEIIFDYVFNNDLVVYGKFNDIVRVKSFIPQLIDISSRVKLLDIDGWEFTIIQSSYGQLSLEIKKRNNSTMMINVQANTNYFLVFSKIVSTDGYVDIRVHLNGEIVSRGTFKSSHKNLASSPFMMGEPSYFENRYNYEIPNFNPQLIYQSNNNVVFIDNVAIYKNIINDYDIYIMYLRTLTYKQVINKYNPKFYTEFKSPTDIFKNNYGSDRLEVNNFTITKIKTGNELYPDAINFKGYGSLYYNYDNNYNYSYTTSLINFNNDFSIYWCLSTLNKDILLYSERDKSNPKHGLTVSIVDGYLSLNHDNIILNTKLFISTGKFISFCVSYNSRNKSITIFTTDGYSELLKITLTNNSEFPSYVTLLNDKGFIENIDITLACFAVYSQILEYRDFETLNREKIDFTVTGQILYRNLPANAKIRLINHYSGELIDTVTTNNNGEFYYNSIYKDEFDIIILNNNKININGIIESDTR